MAAKEAKYHTNSLVELYKNIKIFVTKKRIMTMTMTITMKNIFSAKIL